MYESVADVPGQFEVLGVVGQNPVALGNNSLACLRQQKMSFRGTGRTRAQAAQGAQARLWSARRVASRTGANGLLAVTAETAAQDPRVQAALADVGTIWTGTRYLVILVGHAQDRSASGSSSGSTV